MPTPPQKPSRAPVLSALVTVQVLFGINYLASKVVLDEIPPRAWALLRVSGACVPVVSANASAGQASTIHRSPSWSR